MQIRRADRAYAPFGARRERLALVVARRCRDDLVAMLIDGARCCRRNLQVARAYLRALAYCFAST